MKISTGPRTKNIPGRMVSAGVPLIERNKDGKCRESATFLSQALQNPMHYLMHYLMHYP